MSITVVVFAITLFFLGKDFPDTRAPLAAFAGLCSNFADAPSCGGSFARVTASAEILVNRTIAVVVFAIAGFGLGEVLSKAGAPLTVGAGLCAGLTLSLTRCLEGTVITILLEFFVNLSIAVVVFAIADFRLGEALAKTMKLSLAADKAATMTFADALCARRTRITGRVRGLFCEEFPTVALRESGFFGGKRLSQEETTEGKRRRRRTIGWGGVELQGEPAVFVLGAVVVGAAHGTALTT